MEFLWIYLWTQFMRDKCSSICDKYDNVYGKYEHRKGKLICLPVENMFYKTRFVENYPVNEVLHRIK